MKKIAFVKTGWSEAYKGGPVAGRHAHISDYEEAHEKFNFFQGNDGCFYGYTHPIGANERPPQPKEKEGWLVIFVAAKDGTGPLTIVGWYENAKFEHEYTERPEYSTGVEFETDVHGQPYSFCIKADKGWLIDPPNRRFTVSGAHFRRTPVLYAAGNGKNDWWRQDLAKLALKVVGEVQKDPAAPTPSLIFPDHDHRKKVEEASVIAAKLYLKSKGYKVVDRQKDNCGYDLLAKRSRSPKELHIEVKGTSGTLMRFFMSRNEKQYMPNPKWRLLMVTNSLVEPKAFLFTEKEVTDMFDLKPFAWEAILK